MASGSVKASTEPNPSEKLDSISSSVAVLQAACSRTGCLRFHPIACCLLKLAVTSFREASPPRSASPAPAVIFHGERYLWATTARDAVLAWPRRAQAQTDEIHEQARVMDGGSSVNAQVGNRGTPDDYDEWARSGCQGWDWNGVLPYFRKLENDLNFDGPLLMGGTVQSPSAASCSKTGQPSRKAWPVPSKPRA